MSLEKPIIQDFRLGNFPNVGAANVAEWRIGQSSIPTGLIVRVYYQRTDVWGDSPDSEASALFVFSLTGDEPVFLGYTTDNNVARLWLDAAFQLAPARTLRANPLGAATPARTAD